MIITASGAHLDRIVCGIVPSNERKPTPCLRWLGWPLCGAFFPDTAGRTFGWLWRRPPARRGPLAVRPRPPWPANLKRRRPLTTAAQRFDFHRVRSISVVSVFRSPPFWIRSDSVHGGTNPTASVLFTIPALAAGAGGRPKAARGRGICSLPRSNLNCGVMPAAPAAFSGDLNGPIASGAFPLCSHIVTSPGYPGFRPTDRD